MLYFDLIELYVCLQFVLTQHTNVKYGVGRALRCISSELIEHYTHKKTERNLEI